MPDSFAETSEGVILIANGMQRMLRWDGYQPAATPAGIIAPTQAVVLSPLGGPVTGGAITGAYRAFVRFVDQYGNVSDLSPISGELSVSGVNGIQFNNVQTSGEPKVVRRQILRNTAGQQTTFYVDVDTVDVTSTVFQSTRGDADLATQTAVPLFDSNGNVLANTNSPPPDHKPFLAFHLTRMWAAGSLSYSEGSVEVTRGSTTVVGRGTEWKAEFAGRFVHVNGASGPLEIQACDPLTQRLTLFDPYDGDTNLFAAYAIRPDPNEPNLVYFTEAGLPESWPAFNAMEVPEDGDEVTGLMPKASFLYILKQRHVYRMTAQTDPATDGAIFLACTRGCVNNRCWVIADQMAYLLDEAGVYAFDGSPQAQSVSTQIQPVFQASGGQGPRINWSASRFFHASHYPGQQVIRWFVCLAGDYLPRHALCFAYTTGKWWIEEFARPIGASAVGRFGRETGAWSSTREVVYLGSTAGQVFGLGLQSRDGIPDAAGTLTGQPTAVGICSLTDGRAAFGNLVGVPVAIADGRGRGQVRVIVANDGTTLRFDRPWAVKPDTNSTYEVGGIRYRWVSARMRLAPSEDRDGASLEVLFQPSPGKARFSKRFDFGGRRPQRATFAGVRYTDARDQDGQDFELGNEAGAVWLRFDRNRERSTEGPRFVRLGLDGISTDPPVVFGEMNINGVV